LQGGGQIDGNRALAHSALSTSYYYLVLDPGHWIGFILQGSWVITASFVGAGAATAVATLFAGFI